MNMIKIGSKILKELVKLKIKNEYLKEVLPFLL